MATTTEIQFITYSELKRRVETVLLETQREIESLKVRVYWQAGKLILDYLANLPHEEKDTSQVLKRLAADLQMERSIFFRLLQFAESFPEGVVPGRHLNWTHYRALLTVADAGQRRALAKEAHQEGWPVRRLREEIFKRKKPKAGGGKLLVGGKLDEPERTRFGVHRIKRLETASGESMLSVDLGFEIYRELSAKEGRGFSEGDLAVYSEREKCWQKEGTPEELYYYRAKVQRVVDGDTLLVFLDFGFQMRKRQYLRLRGLDTPPLSTREGKQAHTFLSQLIRKQATIDFKSRSRDPYGRYLSDVWVGDTYVNQIILDRGLARRM